MNSLPQPLVDGLADRYRLERELGAGGMATVYLAQDIRHDRQVAIKVLHAELAAVIGAERFLAEIKTTARLQHPHILPLLDSGAAGGFLFYVMPLVTGETLRARITRERQLPIAESLQIASEVADALGHAHSKGIIHRDIKPENILLQDGHALVADFGIALAVQSAGGERMTQTGLSLGTPQYMSPEQAMGERNIDARSDIYALGAVTYEMLAGEAPFTGPSVQAIVARVLSEEPRALSAQRKSVPAAAEEAVFRALEKLPADRFASAKEFSTALTAQGATTGLRTGARAAPAKRDWRVPALGVALGGALALAAWGWSRPTAPASSELRYRISADSVVDMHDWTGNIAVTADGNTIVRASGPGGPLLRRDRHQLDFVAIPGTAGAQAPCFSPDGARLAFFSNGKLVAMPIGGGATEVLQSELSSPVACAWSDDGFVYFESGRATVLSRVRPEAGAQAEDIAIADSVNGELMLSLPEPIPGSRAMLFVIQYRDGRFAVAFSNGEPNEHRALFSGTRARYLPSGHLVYTTIDGRLWLVGFDAKAGEVRGDPEQLAEGLAQTMTGPTNFAVARNGSVVFAEEDLKSQRELVWITRNGTRTAVDSTWHGAFVGPRISPDGRTIAVTMTEGEESYIWLKPIAGGPARRHTLGQGTFEEPSWSPDGARVSYIAQEQRNGKVKERAVGGGLAAVDVLGIDRSISEQTWSRTGGWLVVRTTTPTAGAGDILRYRPGIDAAPIPTVASPRSEYTPSVSPNGRWLAYASNESGRLEVYVVAFPEPDSRKWQISAEGGISPVWSPKGDELFFLDLRGNLVTAPVSTSGEFTPGDSRVLFGAGDLATRAVSRRNYDVAPDGQRFLMVRRAGGVTRAQMVVIELGALPR